MNRKNNGYGLSNTYRSKPAAQKYKSVPKINKQKVGKAVKNSIQSTGGIIELPFIIIMGMINGIIAVLTIFAGERDE